MESKPINQQISEMQEHQRISDKEFNKSVFAPDSIESIDWTKFNPEDVVMKKVNLPKTNNGENQDDKFAITLENILTAEEC